MPLAPRGHTPVSVFDENGSPQRDRDNWPINVRIAKSFKITQALA